MLSVSELYTGEAYRQQSLKLLLLLLLGHAEQSRQTSEPVMGVEEEEDWIGVPLGQYQESAPAL